MLRRRGPFGPLGWAAGRWRGAREAGSRLDPKRFLAHAESLAAKAPAPRGVWLSVLAEGPAPELEGENAEIVAVEPGEPLSAALRRARAPFVARLGEGGRLTRFAGARIAAALAEHPEAQALYTDEIFTEEGRLTEVVLKPAYDPVLLEGFDYFGRLAVYRRERAFAFGGWGRGEAADHELALRFARAAPPGAILHLPYPAHVGPVRAPKSVARPPPPPPRSWPKVSVIIPNRDSPDLIREALAGLTQRTDYPNFDVTVIDNGTTDPRTLALYQRYAGPRFRVEIRPAPFNFSAAVNRGAALSDGPLLLLLNNDVEVTEPGWLKEMVSCLDYADAGVVGAKLLYPDGSIQHAGVIVGLGGYAGHWHVGRTESELASHRRFGFRQSLSAVTGACMLVTRECYTSLGGFDEESFPVAYNDVDFCLRAGQAGWRVIWTPRARLVHRESASRGSDEAPENRARFALEKEALQARHGSAAFEDRAYNPWAARSHSDPWPSTRTSLPGARA